MAATQIIDAHTHFYDATRAQGVPWPDPASPIYRSNLPDRFRTVTRGAGVTATVVVEASILPEDNDWVLELAEHTPEIVGFVGNLDPQWDRYEAELDRLASNKLFRGIRIRPAFADSAAPAVQRLASRLVDHDLSLDLFARGDAAGEVARLAAAFPQLRLVVNHVAGVKVDGGEPPADWSAAMQALAGHTNVFCKVSGLVEGAGPSPAPADPAFYAPVLQRLTDLFGPERLIWASNWPVCELHADYATTLQIVRAFFSTKGEAAQRSVLAGAALDAYRPVV